MALRERALALAGLHLLGDGFARVAGMLPEGRRAEVTVELERLKGTDRAQIADRLARLRRRQADRVKRIARKRFGASWDRLDPRIAQTVLLHGRTQDH